MTTDDRTARLERLAIRVGLPIALVLASYAAVERGCLTPEQAAQLSTAVQEAAQEAAQEPEATPTPTAPAEEPPAAPVESEAHDSGGEG